MPATQVWLWGQGHAPNMPKFRERFGVDSGCMITGVDLLRGLAVLLGWDVHEVDGMTSFHDTNYAGQGAATASDAGSIRSGFQPMSKPRMRRATRRIGKPRSPPSSTSTNTSSARCWRKLQTFPRVADPGDARSSDQHRHAQARLRPHALCHGRHAQLRKRGKKPYNEKMPPPAIYSSATGMS